MSKQKVSERAVQWPQKFTMAEPENKQECPRHGARYVIRRGTNRCPVGRKRRVDCR